MSFHLYHVIVKEDHVVYEWVKPAPLSGEQGPLARHVRSLPKEGDSANWLLSGRELAGLVHPDGSSENFRILFDLNPRHEWQVTLCELTSISGSTHSDVTHLVLAFKTLHSGHTREPAAQFKRHFTVPITSSLPRFHEALALQGGTSGGTWRWGEPQLSLGAAIVGGTA